MFNAFFDTNDQFGAYDIVHMFSGRLFDGPIKGLAYLSTICTSSAIGIIESVARIPSYHAQIFAHELGHNLGLTHDATRGWVMSPSSSSWSFSTEFSPRSAGELSGQWTGDHLRCLSATNTGGDAYRAPICGNGIIEQGEECDPGLILTSPHSENITGRDNLMILKLLY